LIELVYLLLIPLSFLAFVLKGVATFGPGIVLVPLGALIIGAKEIVLVIGFLDLISNASLLKLNREPLQKSFWLPMVGAIVVGSVLGSILLTLVPTIYFDRLFGLLLLPLGLWMILERRRDHNLDRIHTIPPKPKKTDVYLSAISGCMGGLSGITGPVLAWHLAKTYDKERFRNVMIPLLLASALTRVIVYSVTGSVSTDTLLLVALAIPGLFLGLFVGNRIFNHVSQTWFSRIIGALVVISGVKLLAKN
jgi:uncharacterized membrane protein YfcA